MESKQDVLKDITASSGPGGFSQIFPTTNEPAFTQQRLSLETTITRIRADLVDKVIIPSQDMLELYLFAIHWLMLYDKVSCLRMTLGVCYTKLIRAQA